MLGIEGLNSPLERPRGVKLGELGPSLGDLEKT